MGFDVKFIRKRSQRLAGTMMDTCIIKCTNLLFSETVDIALIPSDGSSPWLFRDTKFNATQSYEFSFDTVDWEWYQDDAIAIVDKSNRILKQWKFHKREFAPGECPECHGTFKCKKCHGTGFLNTRNLESLLHRQPGQLLGNECPSCGGTGICTTCEINYRKPTAGGGPTGLHPF